MFQRNKKKYEEINNVLVMSSTYKSIFDYEANGITNLEIIKNLILLEEKVFYHMGKISENKIELLKALSLAKSYLKHDGTFGNWCKSIGFKNREAISIELKRIYLHEKTDIEYDILINLPIRTIKELTKKNSIYDSNLLKEHILNQNNLRKTNIDYSIEIENLEKKIKNLEKKILSYKLKKMEYESLINKTS
ncbi:hypothetical protein [Cetobacterium sp. SF1]|uniref:hypothetical protein n=1 Tax=Cetobacterium sp. SF1 TaxID=3417654 RepID=UPI003CF62499